MNYLISLAKDIVKKRRLIGELAKADFKKRFVGSYFGIVWMFIQPIVTVAIYYFVFGVGFRSGYGCYGSYHHSFHNFLQK